MALFNLPDDNAIAWGGSITQEESPAIASCNQTPADNLSAGYISGSERLRIGMDRRLAVVENAGGGRS